MAWTRLFASGRLVVVRPDPGARYHEDEVDSHTVSASGMADVMFSIGAFAKYGGVSVRMLRHYDAVGLLRPAHVDPHTGYRFYEADQLARLNRVIALKELGLTLDQVRAILDGELAAGELRGMLRLPYRLYVYRFLAA